MNYKATRVLAALIVFSLTVLGLATLAARTALNPNLAGGCLAAISVLFFCYGLFEIDQTN